MQIRPTSVRLVRLNFGLSLYLDRTLHLSLLLSLSLSRNFGLRPKFRLSERLSEITSLFDLSLVLDRTLAQWKAQRKAKSKSEVAHWQSDAQELAHTKDGVRPCIDWRRPCGFHMYFWILFLSHEQVAACGFETFIPQILHNVRILCLLLMC